MGDLHARTQLELSRRLASLPASLSEWKTLAEGNIAGFGIHRNQIRAIEIMIVGLDAQRGALVDALAGKEGAAFAEGYLNVLEEIAVVDGVWQVFVLAMQQRRDLARRPLLDLADLVAAICYRQGIDRAVAWNAIGRDDARPPPLVVLEAALAPSTVKKGESLGLLGHPLPGIRDHRLPIPVVLVPPDHVESVWLLCAVYHEVGHNLDLDLKLQRPLQNEVLALAPDGMPQERAVQWSSWTPEIVADVIGVLLGGPGYVQSIARSLTVMAPAQRYAEVDNTDRHPSPHVRVPLLCRLLEHLAVAEWQTYSDTIRKDGQANAAPAWATPYVDDLAMIVPLMLDTKLATLQKHALRELIDPLDAARIERIRKHFGNKGLRGDMAVVSFRDVPAAAQLAATTIADPAAGLGEIQKRALAFASAIARPEFLHLSKAILTKGMEQALERMTRELDLRGGRQQ